MFTRITILSPGLLGASVAQAVRAHNLASHISIWARRPSIRREIAQQSWCDSVYSDPAEAVQGAELVVIAAPVDQIVPLVRIIGPHLSPGAIVMDVGSVKGSLCRQAAAALPPGRHFVGAHPMAGSDKTGWRHAQADLFQNRTCFVTPLPTTNRPAANTVAKFWRGLGMSVVQVTPSEHDKIVAHISHLPQLVASTLCATLDKSPHKWRNFAGGGLRDTTRIAGSDPDLWKVIFQHNRTEVLRALNAYQGELQAFQKALKKEDYRLITRILARGQAYRQRLKT